MSVWGKIIGGVAGFAMGGPVGAMVGAAIGHAAESGGLGQAARFGSARLNEFGVSGLGGVRFGGPLPDPRIGREHAFSVTAVVLSAKLAKCDGPVNRAEIDAFKRLFRVPPEQAREVGRLFDEARDSAEPPEPYALRLGAAYADRLDVLEDMLAALFAIARADAPGQVVNQRESGFLARLHTAFGLDDAAWRRASGRAPARAAEEDDPYAVLGVTRGTDAETLRATWKRLMRENHPDSLASRGIAAAKGAGEKVARINAAWDRIKRERGL